MIKLLWRGAFRNENLCQHVFKGLTLIPLRSITSEQTKTALAQHLE